MKKNFTSMENSAFVEYICVLFVPLCKQHKAVSKNEAFESKINENMVKASVATSVPDRQLTDFFQPSHKVTRKQESLKINLKLKA